MLPLIIFDAYPIDTRHSQHVRGASRKEEASVTNSAGKRSDSAGPRCGCDTTCCGARGCYSR